MSEALLFIIEGVPECSLQISAIFFFEPAPVIGGGLGNALGVLLHPKFHVVNEQIDQFNGIPIIF